VAAVGHLAVRHRPVASRELAADRWWPAVAQAQVQSALLSKAVRRLLAVAQARVQSAPLLEAVRRLLAVARSRWVEVRLRMAGQQFAVAPEPATDSRPAAEAWLDVAPSAR
jgi:hypothetical protein